MQKIEVLIEENAFGSVRPIEIVADAPVSALVPALVEELKLPQTDLFGKQLVYMLRQSSGGRILPDNTTLVASGIESGARLALDSYVIDGSVATLLNNTSKQAINPTLHSSRTIADSGGFLLPTRGNTSGIIPVVKPKEKGSRRAFLILGAAVLGVGAAGVGYAAYTHKLPNLPNLSNLLNSFKPKGTTPPQQAQQPKPKPAPVHPKPLVPTKAMSVLSFASHQQTVRSVSWSPDGKMLASGADDSLLYVWGTNGNVRQTIMHDAPVLAVAWAPDSQRVATGSGLNVAFYNAVGGGMIASPTNRVHTQSVTSLAWASRGQMQLVSGGMDNLAIVWNTMNYTVQTIFRAHTKPVNAVAWAPDSQTVASGSDGGLIRVWNANSLQELHGFYQDVMIPLHAVAFLPNMPFLAAGGDDGIVRLRNIQACQQAVGAVCTDVPQQFQASQAPIRTLAWSPDGRFLAVGGDDGTFSVWNPANLNQPLLTMAPPQNAPVLSIVWSPDGAQLAIASGAAVTLWQLM